MLTDLRVVDDILLAHGAQLGGDLPGYRNHVCRVANLCAALQPPDADSPDKIAIAAAMHDLGIWTADTFDYILPSIELATAHLRRCGRPEWTAEVTTMIREHHKLSAYRGNPHWLVEPFRRGGLGGPDEGGNEVRTAAESAAPDLLGLAQRGFSPAPGATGVRAAAVAPTESAADAEMVTGSAAEIRTILFASDLSPESDRAFEAARFLAERFGAQLTIYHALEQPRGEYEGRVDANDDSRANWERKVREELSRRASTLTIPHEVVVQGGLVGGHLLVDLAVLDVIHKRRPDLTVMATRRREGFASFFIGSVTAQVVQHAGQPVLCVRKGPHVHVPPYLRILVTTDFSPASRRAFPLAALMARTFGANVTALHVAPAPRLATLAGVAAPSRPHPPSQDELGRFLQPDFEGLPVEARVRTTGTAWHQIVKTAEEEKTDLIVMSTQGLDSLHDQIIGSNAERVLRHAPCTVLVT